MADPILHRQGQTDRTEVVGSHSAGADLPVGTHIDGKRDQLLQSIAGEIDLRAHYNRSDFHRSQMVAWTSLISSSLATIATAYGVTDPYWRLLIALVAAVPGLMVAIESSFQYSTRSKINGIARYDLMAFRSDLERGVDPYETEVRYFSYMKKLEGSFPGGVVTPTAATSRSHHQQDS